MQLLLLVITYDMKLNNLNMKYELPITQIILSVAAIFLFTLIHAYNHSPVYFPTYS